MPRRAYPEHCWVTPKVEPRASDIEGTGLFALHAIEPGETIAILGGRTLTDDEVRALTPPYSSAALGEDVNVLIDPASIIRYGNHSCDPNAWMLDDVTEVARRPIEPGDEITIDYATHTAMPDWSMRCACGSALCRGVVSGDDWRRTDLQERYGAHWSPFILDRIQGGGGTQPEGRR